MHNLLEYRVGISPDVIALKAAGSGGKTWTYKEYYADIKHFASALIELRIKERSSINIIGYNCAQWFISCLGGMLAYMVPSGVYTTNKPEACVYVANHSCAELVVVDGMGQYEKYAKSRDKLLTAKHFVFTSETLPKEVEGTPFVYSWSTIMHIGKLTYEKNEEELKKRILKQKPGTVCAYVYTSGTTSMPKGCMITHDGFVTISYSILRALYSAGIPKPSREKLVSYLPLSHVYGMATDIITNLTHEALITFAQPDALQGSLVKTLREARPTIFIAVPRIYEKMQAKIQASILEKSGFIQNITNWALKIGHETSVAEAKGQSAPFGSSIAHYFILEKIKQELGLDQSVLRITAGARPNNATMDFFASINLGLTNLYGLTETTGPATFALPSDHKLYSSGKPCDGIEMKISQPDEKGEGEVCFRGKGVFVGYLKDPKSSMEVFNSEGYFHTGDLGYIDSDGFLYVTGRKKDLIKTSGGENIPTMLIEQKFVETCPIASNMLIVGDRKHFLSALITLKSELSKEGILRLTTDALEILKAFGSNAKTLAEAITCPKVQSYIQGCIDSLNKCAISRAQEVKKWVILPRDFSIDEGEITPTMKLKRYVIYKKYSELIERFYKDTKL